MILYFCLILFHIFKFLIINNIPLLNTLSILNIPNVSVFLRLIAYFNSGTKFILLIDFAFFLSIKCLCGFYKPKKLLKPIDLQDHFEVFVCLFWFYFSLLLCSNSLSISLGATLVHLPEPTAQGQVLHDHSAFFFSEMLSASLSINREFHEGPCCPAVSYSPLV